MKRSTLLSAWIPLILGVLSQPVMAQPNLTLPPGALGATSTPQLIATNEVAGSETAPPQGVSSDFIVTFSGVPAEYSIGDQSYKWWCVDVVADFSSPHAYTLYSTYSPTPPLPADAQNPNWPSVNWVLNNKPAPTGTTEWGLDDSVWAVQQTIWKLLFGSYIYPGTGGLPANYPCAITVNP